MTGREVRPFARRDRPQHRKAVDRDRTEADLRLRVPRLRQPRRHAERLPGHLRDAAERRVRREPGPFLAGRAHRDPLAGPRHHVVPAEPLDHRPVVGPGQRRCRRDVEVCDLSAVWLDRHLDTQIRRERAGPRPASDHHVRRVDPLAVGQRDARHGVPVGPDRRHLAVANGQPPVLTGRPERGGEPAAVDAPRVREAERSSAVGDRRKRLPERAAREQLHRSWRGTSVLRGPSLRPVAHGVEFRVLLLVRGDDDHRRLGVAVVETGSRQRRGQIRVVVRGVERELEPRRRVGPTARGGGDDTGPRVRRASLVAAVDQQRVRSTVREVVRDRRADDTATDHDRVEVAHARRRERRGQKRSRRRTLDEEIVATIGVCTRILPLTAGVYNGSRNATHVTRV